MSVNHTSGGGIRAVLLSTVMLLSVVAAAPFAGAGAATNSDGVFDEFDVGLESAEPEEPKDLTVSWELNEDEANVSRIQIAVASGSDDPVNLFKMGGPSVSNPFTVTEGDDGPSNTDIVVEDLSSATITLKVPVGHTERIEEVQISAYDGDEEIANRTDPIDDSGDDDSDEDSSDEDSGDGDDSGGSDGDSDDGDDSSGDGDAFFEVSLENASTNLTAGETFNVAVTVNNTGDVVDTQKIELLDFNQSHVDNETVELDGGNDTQVALEWATEESDTGEGNVTVRSENDTETLSVEIEHPPSSGDGSDGSDGGEDEDDGDSEDGGDGQNDDGDDGSDDDDGDDGSEDEDDGSESDDGSDDGENEDGSDDGENEDGSDDGEDEDGNEDEEGDDGEGDDESEDDGSEDDESDDQDDDGSDDESDGESDDDGDDSSDSDADDGTDSGDEDGSDSGNDSDDEDDSSESDDGSSDDEDDTGDNQDESDDNENDSDESDDGSNDDGDSDSSNDDDSSDEDESDSSDDDGDSNSSDDDDDSDSNSSDDDDDSDSNSSDDGGDSEASNSDGGDGSSDADDSDSATESDRIFFAVTIEEYDENVTEGEYVNVTAKVENTGEDAGGQVVRFLFDGIPIDDMEYLKLSGEESEEVTFSHEIEETNASELEFTVASDDDSANATVTIVEPDDSHDAGGTDTESTSTPTVDEPDETESEAVEEVAESGSLPLLVLLAVGVLLVGLVYVVRNRLAQP